MFFFWIIKNLLPKGESPKPTKKKQAAKSYQNKRKTDSTSPKTEGKGLQPATRTTRKTINHSRNGSPQPGHKPTTLKKQIKHQLKSYLSFWFLFFGFSLLVINSYLSKKKNTSSNPSTSTSTNSIYETTFYFTGSRSDTQQPKPANTSSSISSSGPEDSKRKAPSLAQFSIRGVVSYILEACDP